MRRRLPVLLLALLSAGPAAAQTDAVNFGGIKADTTAPVEVTADSLTVSQTDGTAVFQGKVLIGQGAMRLSADRVVVEYEKGSTSKISSLVASGHVTLVSGPAQAEAEKAVYTIGSGAIDMSGNVLLTQGTNAMTGEKLSVDLKTGTGRMDGRVKTVLQPGGN